MTFIEVLTLPFMQKALVAGLILGAILPLLGVFATLKRMSFFGDGIAHASLAGVAIGVLAGLNPFWMALLVGVLFGIGIYILERKTTISSDAIIGLIFTTGLAIGVLLLGLQEGYQPELITFLFGNILAIGSSDLFVILILGGIIVVFLSMYFRQLTLMILDRGSAWLSGISVGVLEFIFYIVLSAAVVLGVKLLGIILVSALLIIPPTVSKLIAPSFAKLIYGSVIVGEVAVVFGLIFSYYLDIPSGATIILTAATLFFITLIFQRVAAVWRKPVGEQ